ncbi:MAG: hypothetical protein GY754_36130 [bacterium]|nr:hypothetical protein [bacterium]
MTETPDKKKKDEAVKVTVSSGTMDMKLETKEKYEIKVTQPIPFIDAHIHIQSTNCVPLPVQWAKAYFESRLIWYVPTSKEKYTGRKEFYEAINKGFVAWLARKAKLGDFPRIMRLSTDLIARIFMREAKDSDMRSNLYWLFWSEEKMQRFNKAMKILLGLFKEDDEIDEMVKKIYRKRAEAASEMTDISLRRKEIYKKEFLKVAAYYFKDKEPIHSTMMLPMDLSFAHFWGRMGLPIYLPSANKNFFFINDFAKVMVDYNTESANISGYETTYIAEDELTNWFLAKYKIMDYDFDLEKYITECCDYLKYAADEDASTFSHPEMENLKAIIICDELTYEKTVTNSDGSKMKTSVSIDQISDKDRSSDTVKIEKKSVVETILKDIEKKDDISDDTKREKAVEQLNKDIKSLRDSFSEHFMPSSTKKKYLHLIEPIAGDNSEIFEEFRLQMWYHEVACLSFPIGLYSLYHYDPRRHITVSDATSSSKSDGPYKVNRGESLISFANRHRVIHGIANDEEAAEEIWNYTKNTKELRLHEITRFHPNYRDSEQPRLIYTGYYNNRNNYDYYCDRTTKLPNSAYTKRDKLKYIIIHPLEKIYVPISKKKKADEHDKAKKDKLAAMAAKIPKEHVFFSIDKFKFKTNSWYLEHKFSLLDRYKFLPRLSPVTFINETYLTEKVFVPDQFVTNDEVFKRLLDLDDGTDGIFWGIKMYSELGYEPADFDLYPHMEELFKKCAKESIPVYCHCSGWGMTIGDSHLYKKAAGIEKATYDTYESADYIDATSVAPKKLDIKAQETLLLGYHKEYEWYDRGAIRDKCSDERWREYMKKDFKPKNWEMVLEQIPDLKLNLCHFSGFHAWREKPDSFDWRQDIVDMITHKDKKKKEYPNLYTDISNLLSEKKDIPSKMSIYSLNKLSSGEMAILRSICSEKDGVLNFSWFASQEDRRRVENILRKRGYIKDDIEAIAKNLAKAINDDSSKNLKNRILAGTDWFMGEASDFSQGKNYGRIFELLRSLSGKLDTPFDAWHQFVVINPLNFLGLIKVDDEGKPNDCKIDVERLNKYKDRCVERLKFDKMIDLMKLTPPKVEIIKKKFEKKISKLESCTIKNSEDVKKDGDLLILS